MSKAQENMSYEQLLEEYKKQEILIAELQFQIDQLNRLLFGAKRERFISNKDENQLSLCLPSIPQISEYSFENL